jgi:hypothetical protein
MPARRYRWPIVTLMGMAVPVLYVVSYYSVAFAVGIGWIPPHWSDRAERTVYAPVMWYVKSKLPGRQAFVSSLQVAIEAGQSRRPPP